MNRALERGTTREEIDMKHLNFRASTMLAASAIAITTPLSALAQDNNAASTSPNRDVIVVTAQGREQSLQDVPLAVSVASGEDLDRENIKILTDLGERMGNVKVTSGTLVNSINIRGAGAGENPGFEQSVATFADGVYRSRSRAIGAALFDVERVEIIKGPQSTFFGANAVAGALNITTRKPGNEFEWNASALYAFQDGEYDTEAGVSVPLTDRLSIRGAIRASGMDGYVTTPTGDGPDIDNIQGRVSLHWEPTDNWTTDFRADIVDTDAKRFAPFQILNCPPPAGFPMSPVCGIALGAYGGEIEDELNFEAGASPSSQSYDFMELALTNAWAIEPGTIRSITAYSDMTNKSHIDLLPLDFYPGNGGYDGFPVDAVEEYEFFSQEIRFESNTGNLIDYMVGAYFSQGDLNFKTLATFNFLPFGAIIEDNFGDIPEIEPDSSIGGFPQSHVKDKTFSGFASATINVSDSLRVNLGARYSRINKDGSRTWQAGITENSNIDTFMPFQDPLAEFAFITITNGTPGDFAVNEVDGDKFMPSASIQYDIADHSMVYANYARGFKAGGFSTTATPATFGPETVDAYEIGLKGQYFDRALTLSLAGFYMDYQGLQETVFDANLFSTIDNAAKSVSKGAEATFDWQVAPALSFVGDIAYLDATYKDYPNGGCTKAGLVGLDPECVGGLQDMSGKRRPFAPKWSGSVGARFNTPVTNGYSLSIDPTVSFSTNYFMTATADPLLKQEGYAKYDVRVGFGPDEGPWQIAMIGKNLSDEVTTFYRLGTPGADGSVTALVDRGRSIALQFSIRN